MEAPQLHGAGHLFNAFDTWIDTSVGSAELRAGRNKVAVKTCDDSGGWNFYFRIAGDAYALVSIGLISFAPGR